MTPEELERLERWKRYMKSIPPGAPTTDEEIIKSMTFRGEMYKYDEELRREKYELEKRAQLEAQRRVMESTTKKSGFFGMGGAATDKTTIYPLGLPKEHTLQVQTAFTRALRESSAFRSLREEVERFSKMYSEVLNPDAKLRTVLALGAVTSREVTISLSLNVVYDKREDILIAETANFPTTDNESAIRTHIDGLIMRVAIGMVHDSLFRLTSSIDSL